TERLRLPQERKTIEARLAATGAALDAVKQKSKEIEIERKKLELDVQSKETAIAKYKQQQYQTRKNEEFQALSNEIKRMELEISVIEDRELELMEQADQLKAQIVQSEKE